VGVQGRFPFHRQACVWGGYWFLLLQLFEGRCEWGFFDSLSGTQDVRKSANVLHASFLSNRLMGGFQQ
jgi:hypothetical protein